VPEIAHETVADVNHCRGTGKGCHRTGGVRRVRSAMGVDERGPGVWVDGSPYAGLGGHRHFVE
jgi:hypothetical protein